MTPREEVSMALASQVEVFFGALQVQRNKPEPADIDDRPEQLCLNDGPEEEEKIDEQWGVALHPMHVAFVFYFGGEDVGTNMNEALGKLRAALVEDRTLGGLLWGEVKNVGFEFSYFDGMTIGALSEWDAFATIGSSPGGYFVQEVVVVYATPPDDPNTLLTQHEVRGA